MGIAESKTRGPLARSTFIGTERLPSLEVDGLIEHYRLLVRLTNPEMVPYPTEALVEVRNNASRVQRSWRETKKPSSRILSFRSGFRGRSRSRGVFAFALARNTPRRNDRHRWFCRLGFASFPWNSRRTPAANQFPSFALRLCAATPDAAEGQDFPIPFRPSVCLSPGRTVGVLCGFI